MDYSLIEFLVGIVTIVGFIYKFERDTREDLRRDIEELRIGLTNVQRDVEELREEVRKEVSGLRTDINSLRKDIEELRSEVRSGFSKLANTIDSIGEAIIEYLGIKSILDPNEARFLRAVIKNLATTTTNPLTEEERKRLLELVDKDDLTIEEAEELYRLARKLYREYIDKTPDAFAALLYAAFKRKEAYMKHWQTTQSQPQTQP
jgi:MoaA/NifB/PqqE/SkfB family radical SAM enzyme